MAVQILIDGVNRTNWIEMESIQLSDSVPARTDTMAFNMVILASEISIKPRSGNEIYLRVNGIDEFAGEVSSVQEVGLINALAYRYNITAVDWTRRMDRLLVTIQEIGPLSAGAVLRQVVTQFAPEFAGDLSDIQDGVAAGQQQYDYSTVTSAFDSLAAASGYIWYVDTAKKIHFVPPLEYQSPLLNNIYDVDGDVRLGNFQWEEDITQVKNRIYIKDALVKDGEDRTDTYISDGTSSFLKLFQEPEGVDSTTVLSHLPDGTTKEWNISLIEEPTAIYGEDGVAFLCILNWGLQFPVDASTDKPFLAPGEVIDVTTSPMRDDIVYMVEDIESQRMMADRENVTWNVNGGGIYEFLASLQGARLASADAAEDYGRVLLTQMAWPIVRGSFTTQHYPGWRAGQTFFLRSSNRDIYDEEAYWRTGSQNDIQVWVSTVSRKLLLVTDSLFENDFEYDTLGLAPPAGQTVSISTETDAPTGFWPPVLKVTTTNADPTAVQDIIIGRLDGSRIPVEGSVGYTISHWRKRSTVGSTFLSELAVDWYDSTGTYISTSSSSATVGASWSVRTITDTSPAAADTAVVRVRTTGHLSTTTFYMDGWVFRSTAESTHNMIMQTSVSFSNRAIEG